MTPGLQIPGQRHPCPRHGAHKVVSQGWKVTRQVHIAIQGRASTSLNVGLSDTEQETRGDTGAGKRVIADIVMGENY